MLKCIYFTTKSGGGGNRKVIILRMDNFVDDPGSVLETVNTELVSCTIDCNL